jgi:hypothetical protein
MACFANSNQDTIKAKLVEMPVINANCGVMAIGGVYVFSDNDNTKIYIIVLCPETYGKGYFEKDKIYEIVCTQDLSMIRDYYIVNLPAHSEKLLLASKIIKLSQENN